MTVSTKYLTSLDQEVLRFAANGPFTSTDLDEETGLDRTRTSYSLRKLVSRRLLVREREPRPRDHDGRALPRGRGSVPFIYRMRGETLRGRIDRALREAERIGAMRERFERDPTVRAQRDRESLLLEEIREERDPEAKRELAKEYWETGEMAGVIPPHNPTIEASAMSSCDVCGEDVPARQVRIRDGADDKEQKICDECLEKEWRAKHPMSFPRFVGFERSHKAYRPSLTVSTPGTLRFWGPEEADPLTRRRRLLVLELLDALEDLLGTDPESLDAPLG